MNEYLAKNRRVVVGLAVVCGLSLAIICREWTSLPSESATQAKQQPETPGQLVERHLKWAEENCMAGVGQEVQPVGMFFGDARLRTRRFAEAALSMESKWKMTKDYFTGRCEHSAFMQERFETLLFSGGDLDSLVEGVVAMYLKRAEEIDSQMLLNLQADLAGLAPESYSGVVDHSALAQRLDLAIREAMAAAQADLRSDVGREIASLIAGEVVAQAMLSLAASSSILGAGAVGGTVTFGVGVIVGFIVDAIVSEIYDRMYDPAGELTKKLDGHLSELERLVLEGTPDSPGLKTRLRECASRRGTIRRQAIRAAVLPVAM